MSLGRLGVPHVSEHLADRETVTLRDTLMIAIPAVALIIVVAAPGEQRWLRRPWFINGPPRRRVLEAFFAILLLVAIFRALA